jgi:hypothetical protein
MRPESGVLSAIILLAGALFHFIPQLRKRNLYFGVTVAEGFRESEEAAPLLAAFAW